ncbi:MAG: NAD(P)/FAD-dependent oxidoreductase [Alphaproteobacteria bacterium]|nr:MAG: NAD(P)/FAD-dependent oxidoreductase [Alphaproteobacteria bacterium]
MHQNNAHHTTDVVIIGAGPVGLFAIFQCGMLKMRCHVIDSLPEIGGQCSALYPEKPIYDIPAYSSISGAELIQQLQKQAEPFDPVYHLGEQVMHVARHGEGWRVTTSHGTIIEARVIMIAGGCGAFGPNRPPLDGLAAYEGNSIFYHVARQEQFRGKRIVIAGGGDSAVDWVNALADVASKIYVVHRRPKFRAAPQSVSQIQALAKIGDVVEMVIPYQLHGLHGCDGVLEAVDVATLEGDVRRLEADILLPFFGLSMELGPIATWGLQLDMSHIKVHHATMHTNQQGIFAIGDIATYEGKLKLILCGFSEAAMAAHAAYPLVHPDTALHFEYSTSKGVPI